MKTLEEQRAYGAAKQRRWRLLNPDKVKEKYKRDYWRRREKMLEKNRLYKQTNPDYWRDWCKKNSERYRNYYLTYYKNNRLRVRARHYDLSPAAFGLMELQQRSCCAVCGKAENRRTKHGLTYALAIDHNRTTGAVRALICGDCNLGIGKFKDDPKLLRAAAEYLESHRP
jgi:hypothetical protein